MDCRDVNNLMEPFFDRELDNSSADEVRNHLAACQACGRRWGGLNLLLTDPEPVEVPAGLRDRIMTAWDTRQAEPASIPISRGWKQAFARLRYAGAIAACVLFFITGWLVSDRWGGKPAPVVVQPSQPREITVVVSPWILSSMAQATAMPAPVSPVVMLAGGVVPEMMAPQTPGDESIPRIRPASGSRPQPSEPETPDMPPLPLVPQYWGA